MIQTKPIYQTYNRRCGLYIADRIKMQNNELKEIQIPLKSCEYEVQIVNNIANITLLQTYQNPTNKYLELQYNFPINPNACVYRFLAEFGNKKIEGVIKEKEEAKKEYNQAIKNGKQAALGQIDSKDGDILNLQIGNVAPNQNVKIQITYLQELTLSTNIFYQFHMVGSISPKYMSNLSNSQIKHGYRNENAKVKGQFYWHFRIVLKTSKKVSFFDSKSHDIKLVSQNDTQTESVFEMTQSCTPAKDFVFTYTTENYELPSYVFGRTDSSSTAMISFIPKFCELNINDAYKASVLGTPIDTDINNARGEYIFLLDRSGSMKGKRIAKAKQALILFVKSLPQDTFFNIISFGTGNSCLFPQSVKYNDKQIEKGIKEVKRMDADMGGTQIYAILKHIMSKKPIDGYPKHIFLLTDGAVSDTNIIVDMIEANNKYSRVHTIGIGNGTSQKLIIDSAKKGKGHHVFISDEQDPSQKIIQLLTDSLSPLVNKMNLTYDKDLIQSIIPNPQCLPYVLKGQIVNFFINFKGQLDKKTKISFTYEDTLNKLPYCSQIQIDPQSSNESFIDRMAHFKKIRLLQSSLKTNSNILEHMFYVKQIDKKALIIDLSVKHQILSQLTAFISVQKELIDGKYQQVKSKGQIKIQIQHVKPVQKQQMANSTMSTLSRKKSIKPIQMLRSKIIMKKKFQRQLQREKQQFIALFKQQKQITIKKNKKMKMAYKAQRDQYKQIKMEKMAPISNYLMKQQSKIIVKQGVNINDVISYQSSNGSWNSIELAEQLYGVKVMKQIFVDKTAWEMRDAIITYLVCKWIQKNYPSKQYNLVVKKGYSFVKTIDQKSMELFYPILEKIVA